MSVRLTSAKLGTGLLSHESPIPMTPKHGKDLREEEINRLFQEINLAPSPPDSVISEVREIETETRVIDRPAWQAFVVCLQLHFPEVAADLDPAHNIGKVPPERVTLNEEAISFLNTMMEVWYQREVEITTVSVATPGKDELGPLQEVLYKAPFRPVTGLNLIVAPTIQQGLDRRTKTILRVKQEWGAMTEIKVLSSAYDLVVKERVKEVRKKGRRQSKRSSLFPW